VTDSFATKKEKVMSKFNPNDFSFEVSIPSAILFNDKIEPACIKLFAIIKGLTRAHGYCYATNAYLAECMDATERSVQMWLKLLKTEGFIEIHTEKFGINWQRHIYLPNKFKKMFTKGNTVHPPTKYSSPPHEIQFTHISNKEISNKEINTPPPAPVCVFLSFGKYVKVEETEYDTLVATHGEPLVTSIIDQINDYIASKGKPYKDYAATIRNWIRNSKQTTGTIPKPEKDLNKELMEKVKIRCKDQFERREMREDAQGIEFVRGQYNLLIKYTDFGFREQLLNQLRKMGIDTGGI
jgi:hypothetical protein